MSDPQWLIYNAMDHRWHFTPVRAGDIENDAYADELFDNPDISLQESLVRETIQNSLDAPKADGALVRVAFRFKTFPTANPFVQLLEGLSPHLAHLPGANAALGSASRALIIEDFETKGLTGPTDRKAKGTNWFGFFWRFGRSDKGGQSGGRRGLGRNVFAIASELRAFWAVTIRSDEPNSEYLMGLAAPGGHTIGSDDYQPYGHFASRTDANSHSNPLSDRNKIGLLKKALGVTRQNETGTSVIIPYYSLDLTPEETLRCAVRNYLVPIYEGTLSVTVDDKTVNRENLRGWLKDNEVFKGDVDDFLDFIDEALTTPETSIVSLEAPERQWAALEAEHFPASTLAELKASFEAGRLIALALPVRIQRKNAAGNAAESIDEQYLVFIRRTKDKAVGRDIYMRGKMPVQGEAKFLTRPAWGLLLARQPAITELLGDSEGAAHYKWSPRHAQVKRKYRAGERVISFVNKSLRDLADILMHVPDERDSITLAPFFPMKKEGTQEGGPGDREIESKEEIVQVTSLKDGFRARLKSGAEIKSYPIIFEIEVAYSLTGRNPFKAWSPSDFSFEEDAWEPSVEGGRLLSRQGKTILVEAADASFSLTSRGYDQKRDLRVRCTSKILEVGPGND